MYIRFIQWELWLMAGSVVDFSFVFPSLFRLLLVDFSPSLHKFTLNSYKSFFLFNLKGTVTQPL